MKLKKKEKSGSIKLDLQVYEEVAKFCKENGIKIGFFLAKAAEEKLQKEKLQIN